MSATSPGHRAQRTRATVMFADLVGFTALTETVGPERAYAISTGCLKLLDGIARKHGGAVDKYLGDSLMAVFGYPVPLEGASRAAVRAALEIRERVHAYVKELALEPRLRIHVGINTGELVAGDIRGPVVREFHVLGDCVNVAARLKAKAPLGRIYVGAETEAETRGGFAYAELEPLALKGKSRRVPAFELLGSREPLYRERLGSGEPPFSDLVGREAELEELHSRVAALAAGRGGAVLIRGEEGVGKTRLLERLDDDAAARGLRRLQFGPRAGGGRAELQLAAGLVAAWAGVEGGDDPEAVEARIRAGPGAATLPVAVGDLAALVAGGAAAEGALDAGLRRALVGILERLCEDAPLLLALEDLHLADAAGLALVEDWLAVASRRPLLVLLGVRSGSAAEGLASALPTGVGAELALGPLSAEDGRRLVEALGGGQLPQRPRALLLERAAGNPGRLLLGVFLAAALESEEAQADRELRPSDAERRRATILFADITGFTAMTERLGPETAYPIVAGALSLLDEVARRHGGTVDKYMGDCVMALFGIPVAIEDAPRAALNAAIEMRRRIQEYNDTHGLELRLDVHTGIHTGLGIAGDISGPLLREFAVMGESVEVASLLTDRAEAGQVFVGPETWRSTRERFEFEEREPLRLDGRSGALDCYELRSDRAQLHRGRLGAERRIFSALVGREAELARLEESLAALRRGRGGTTSVIADAGVGKSRLVAELRASAAAEGLAWVEGRSLSNGARLSYHPFADLVRQWARVDDGDDDASALAKLEALVAGLLAEDAEEVLPFVASVSGMRLDAEREQRVSRLEGDAREKRVRNAVTDLLRAGARAAPTVVVMDDLHWADQSSIELLESVLPLVGEQPLLLLNVFRPGYADTSGRILAGCRGLGGHAEIELRPLDAGATRLMLNNLFRQGDIPQRTRALIEEKAGGNPFYIEEVVRSLVDQGAIESHDDRFRATERIHEVEIPGTIQEVIMARVDRLGAGRRRLLQTAAVVGQNFHEVVLDALAPDVSLEEELASLVEAEFLVPSDRLQGREFAFKHPLIHEVTYAGLLETRREELHREVAEAIEARLPDSVPGHTGMLAYHFSKGRDAERAEEYLFRAGDEAARVAASSEALHFFREASKLYLELHGEGGDPAKRALLEKSIARALYHRGQLPEAEEHFNQAIEHLGVRVPRSDRALLLGAVRNLVPMLSRLYLPPLRRRPPADETRREVFELMVERSLCEVTSNPTRFVVDTLDGATKLQRYDPETVPVATRFLAGASTIFSYGGISFALSRRCLDLAGRYVREGDTRSRMMYELTGFIHHSWEGDWSPEHEVDEALLDEAVRDGLLWDVVTYLGTHAEQRCCKGDFGRTRERLRQVDELWERYDHDLAKSTHYALTMYLALEEGRLDDAVGAADAYYEENPEELLHILALGGKAKAQLGLGDLDGAEATLEVCGQRVEEAGGGRVPPYQLSGYQRSRLLLDVARFEAEGGARVRRRARRSLRAALGGAARCALRRVEVYRLAGLLAWLSDDVRGATRWWERALGEARRLGARPQLARTHAELARRLDGAPVDAVGGLDAAGHRQRAGALEAELGLARPPARGVTR